VNSKQTHIGSRQLKPESQMMHYGYDPSLSEGSVKCPKFQTSTFAFDSAQAGKDFFNYASGRVPLPKDQQAGLIYSRFNNPVLEILEGRIALWDEAEDCMVTASGMAAISTTMLALSKPGDVVVYSEPVYGGTDALLGNILSQYQVQSVGFCSSEGVDGFAQAMAAAQSLGPVSLVFIETPDNPTNQIIDLRACADIITSSTHTAVAKPVLVVDNTMYGPLFQQPLKHGADICLYSLTKYIGGHSDVVGGAISGCTEVIEKIRGFRNIMGTTMDPNTAWLIMRSLETLKVRMEASAKTAEQVVEYLNQHKNIERIYYPGLLREGEAQYDIFNKQCSGCSSTFSFVIKGGEAEAFKVLDNMSLAILAVSLGGTETLIQHPASMTHSCVPAERRAEIGITDNLIRISIGLENAEDLIADLAQALATL